jgi:predicted DNA-binding protein (UPF0251 family)
MSTDRRALPDVLRGLILAAGLSHQEAAVRSGVSPGSVASICERIPKPLMTWMRLISALSGQVVLTWQDQRFDLAMPRIPAAVLEREWASWRTRRVVTTVNHLRHAEPKAKRSTLDERARSYAANEEVRLRERLALLRASCAELSGTHRTTGLRSTIRMIASRIGLKAEELTLLAGASLSACQLALGDPQDGRVATMHRLCSALGARLEVLLPSAQIAIGFCPPGDWRPGMPAADASHDPDEKPPGSVRVARDNQNRSSLSHGDILSLYDQGLSIGEIARKAGVSRQRVHKLAMDHGRTHRRQTTRDQRVVVGRDVLGMT